MSNMKRNIVPRPRKHLVRILQGTSKLDLHLPFRAAICAGRSVQTPKNAPMPPGTQPKPNPPRFRSTLTMYKSCRIIDVTQGCQGRVNELLGRLAGSESI